MRNKLYIILIGILCFGVMAACEIPGSAAIKGHPGLYVNLGSAFGKENDILKDLDQLKIENLQKEIGDETGKIYEYTSTSIKLSANDANPIDGTKVQTYLVHFPITELPLNFSQYLTEQNTSIPLRIDPVPPGVPVDFPQPLPKTTLEMKEITKWVNSIYINDITGADGGKKSKITLSGSTALINDLEDKIELKVASLGIPAFVRGVKSDDGRELVFSATEDVPGFDPKSTAMVIETQLVTAPTRSGTVSIDVDFQWKEANVKPGTEGTEGFKGVTDAPKMNFLEETLGVQFWKLPAYLYITGLEDADDPRITLSSGPKGGAQIPMLTGASIASKGFSPPPKGITEYSETITGDNTSVKTFLSLENVFNATGDVTISYEISIGNGFTVDNDDEAKDKKIKADMVVILPLQFGVPVTPGTKEYQFPGPDGNSISYYSLGDKALSSLGIEEGKDLLQRDPGEDDFLTKGIGLGRADIRISKIQNNVIQGLSLAVKTNPVKDYPQRPEKDAVQVILLEQDGGGTISFTGDEIKNPFNPGFMLLVEKGKPYIEVNKLNQTEESKLDLNLALSASADLDMSVF